MIRVLLAEDVPVVRDTLAALLGLEPDIEVTASLASGDQVVSAALAQRPDVALLDIGLPGASGLTAAAELARHLPACRVLILTGLEASGNLAAALRAGARGFLLKDRPADDLIAAVRAVARGEQIIDPRLAEALPDPGEGSGQAR
jgi:two-component system, NarL family, response regulator DesR